MPRPLLLGEKPLDLGPGLVQFALVVLQIKVDAEFYGPTISEDSLRLATKFAQEFGVLSGPVAYEDVVATQLASLWTQ
jgi:hypothetical protein